MGSVSKRIISNVRSRRMAVAAGITVPITIAIVKGVRRYRYVGVPLREYRRAMVATFRNFKKSKRRKREMVRAHQEHAAQQAVDALYDVTKRGWLWTILYRMRDAWRRFRGYGG